MAGKIHEFIRSIIDRSALVEILHKQVPKLGVKFQLTEGTNELA